MKSLRQISGDNNLHFYGYGGSHMSKEGFSQEFDLNIDNLPDKAFHTYRKTKGFNKFVAYKWNPFNLVNKAYMRTAD